MKNGVEDFVVESTPVLDLKKNGIGIATPIASDQNWDSDRTEVYADADSGAVVASLIGEHGETFPITTFPYVIGRGSECDLVLQGKGVSRLHAEIIFQSGRFVVNDLESLNGLKVNGYKVARVILEENDTIKLGEVGLVFRSSSNGVAQTNAGGDSKKKPKLSLFGARPAKSELKEDNTFGGSPFRKWLLNCVLLIVTVGVGWFGYSYWLMQPSGASRSGVVSFDARSASNETTMPIEESQSGVDISASANVDVAVVAEPSQALPVVEDVQAGISQSVSSVDPPPSIAPPPSLSRKAKPEATERASINQASVSSETKATVEVKQPRAVVNPPNKVPEVNNSEKAKAALVSAEAQYLKGDAQRAIEQLKPFLADTSLAIGVRTEVKKQFSNLNTLNQLYLSGQTSFGSGNKEVAFSNWTSFMQKESDVFSGRKSAYTQSISSKVMNEYVTQGNEAAKAGDNHKAYRLWQKSLDIGENVAARIAIDNADNRGMQLYRQALRLEYVNTSKAKALWLEVVNLLPPGTEYNTKAGAKLAWYEKWGS